MQGWGRLGVLVLGLSLPAAAQAPVWVSAGPAGVAGGPIETLAAGSGNSPQTLLAGGAGGVWLYSQEKWSALSDGAPVSALAVTAQGAIYAGTGDLHGARSRGGEGIEFSADGGQSWSLLGGAVLSGAAVSGILLNPNNAQQLWVATLDAGLLASQDGGTSWTSSLSGNVWDVAQSGTNLLAVGSSSLELSADGGAFAPLSVAGLPPTWVRGAAAGVAGGGFVVALALPSGAVSVWTISAAGVATNLPPPPVTASARGLALAAMTTGNVWVGGNGVAETSDGGMHWEMSSVPGRVSALLPAGGGSVWVGSDQGVWQVGSGAAAASLNAGLGNVSLLAGTARGNLRLAALDGGGVLGLPAATAGEFAALAANNTGVCGLRASDGSLTCTADRGATWTAATGGYTSLAAASAGFWLGTANGQVLDPAGGTHPVATGAITALALSGGTVWAAAGSQLYQSQDGGVTWQSELTAAQSLTALAASADTPNLVAVVYDATVEASADGGQTWHDVSGGLTQAPVTALWFESNDQLWAVTLGRGWWNLDLSAASEQITLNASATTVTAGSPVTVSAAVTAFGAAVANGGVQFSANHSQSQYGSWTQSRDSVTFTPFWAGNWTVAAQYGNSTATTGIQVTAAAAARLQMVSGQNQRQTAGSLLTQPIVLQVNDSFGNGVSGAVVNLSGGDFSSSTATTDAAGRAQVNFRLPNTVGTVTLTAATAGVPAAEWQETALPAPDYALVLTPPATAVAPGHAGQLTVAVVASGGYAGTVALTCLQPATGCSVTPAAVTAGQSATVTVHVTGNQAAQTVVIAADSMHQASAQLPMQAFTLAPGTLTVTVNAGQGSVPVPLQLTSVNGLTGAAALAIAGLPASLTAVFEPSVPTLNASGPPAPVQFTLLAAQNAGLSAGEAAGGLLLCLVAFTSLSRRRRWIALAAATLLTAACGGGGVAAPPPAVKAATVSTYNLQVTAIVSGLSAAVPLTVNVLSQ